MISKESIEDSETMRDALYLANILIHKNKQIRVEAFELTLSEERVNRAIASITYDSDITSSTKSEGK
tara:strand:+ start:5027 stop:5227 length:201 start_codon:yes stop_codon:yes gene_type:complete